MTLAIYNSWSRKRRLKWRRRCKRKGINYKWHLATHGIMFYNLSTGSVGIDLAAGRDVAVYNEVTYCSPKVFERILRSVEHQQTRT